MSLAQKRAAFKAVLDTIDGVTGFRYRPSTPKAGDAWPLLGEGERDQQSGQFTWTWAVVIYLPADVQAADDWLDANADEFVDALETIGVAYVDTITPSQFGDESSPVLGLLITTRSE